MAGVGHTVEFSLNSMPVVLLALANIPKQTIASIGISQESHRPRNRKTEGIQVH